VYFHLLKRRAMLDPDDLCAYEICFPGAITGETEVTCPHCNELLTVPVDDPMGTAEFQCANCGQSFVVNFGG
jgi:DNA-directed RNA polymerase subunit RPC12/RpoP